MSIERELLGYLDSNSDLRKDLYRKLGADARDVNAYYLCPLTNLRPILEEGIKSRNRAGEVGLDLSGNTVQQKRNVNLYWLARNSELKREKPVHSCVNLFWNPLSKTFQSFQRNALLRARDDEEEAVCILEIDVRKLLEAQIFFWGVSKKNIASNRYVDYRIQKLREFPWKTIFSTHNFAGKEERAIQAAELLFYSDTFVSVPPKYIKRVIVSHANYLSEKQRARTRGKLSLKPDVYQDQRELLHAELGFVRSTSKLKTAGLNPVKTICDALEALCIFEQTYYGPGEKMFVSKHIAQSDFHGVGHVTRVMFWSVFLYQSTVYEARGSDEKTILTAALIHDLARKSHLEDVEHGQLAVENRRYQQAVEKILDGEDNIEACYRAVAMHCRRDDECLHKDIVWQILKDADAVDRGRFGKPGRGGCDPKQLRGFAMKGATLEAVPVMAYNLARMTRYTEWVEYPCRDLLRTILSNMKQFDSQKIPLDARAQVRSKEERDMVTSLINRLKKVDDDLEAID